MRAPSESADAGAILSAATALLRGDPGAAAALGGFPVDGVLASLEYHGLRSLVAHAVRHCSDLPSALSEALCEGARAEALLDMVRRPQLETALAALAGSQVEALVFKGEQLAQICYERPDLRPRLDTDILVRPADRQRAYEGLARAGYTAVPQLEADLISYQRSFLAPISQGVSHVIDLHWRISNPQAFGRAVAVDDVFDAGESIPGLHARGPGLPHVLLLCIVHPIAHHAGRSRLLWDLDTALVSGRMREVHWAAFLHMNEVSGMGRLSVERLRRAVDLFRAEVPDGVLDALARMPAARVTTTRPLQSILASVKALPRWSERLALIRQHLIPSPNYMREIYAPFSRAPLTALYIERVVRGAWKYCRRS